MHPRLTNCALKRQEGLFLYDYVHDERYELDEESFEFLRHCTGQNTFDEIISTTDADPADAEELMKYLLSEGCVEDREDKGGGESYDVPAALLPSLRYLQLHVTERCNLDCSHCYLGEKGQKDLEIDLIKKALDEFSPCGLKVLITGGEALMHKQIWEVLQLLSSYPVRIELLSNGTLITRDVARRLAKYVHAVQISLDGMKQGHDMLRGRGCFEKTVKGIRNASLFLDVSIATMVHAGNLNEFEEMKRFVDSLGAREWSLDVPSLAGNATVDIIPPADEAAERFNAYGYGEGVHEGDGRFSCGSHICSVNVNGGVSKCGFFEKTVGNLKDTDLLTLWKKVVETYTPPVADLKCADCQVVEVCRGGCRYRAKLAGDFLGKDPLMCRVQLGGR